jgi:hypothetical protein
MAIEPYQRKIGIPDAAGGGMTRIADTRSFDIGPAISSLGETLMSTFEPILADKAIKRGNEEAGKVMFERTETGQLVLPPPAEDGGRRYAAAFDKVIQTRYLNEVGTATQQKFDQRAADARTGVKPYDAQLFADDINAMVEGTLSGVDPRIRPQLEEVLQREALERTRAFTNEWSGNKRRQAIDGALDQIRFHQQSLKNWKQLGYKDRAEAIARHGGPIEELLGSLTEIGGVDKTQADAVIKERDQTTDGIDRYVESMKSVTTILPAVDGMSADDLSRMEYMLRGVPLEGGVTGIIETEVGATEAVTPEGLKAFVKADFGFEATSGARAADHPLSIAARAKGYISNHDVSGSGGGRAIDIPANGKPIEFYIERFKKAGFEILEADDEYKKPSAIATGGHYHFSFGNKRKVTATHELPGLKETVNFEFLDGLDGSAKQVLLGAIVDRQQQIRSDEAEARQQAADNAREARDASRTQTIVDSITYNSQNGISNIGADGPQKAVLTEEFRQRVDVTKLNDPQQRANAAAFITQRGFIPEILTNYLDSNIRGANFTDALDMYNQIKTTTLGPNGARVGDLLISKLEPRTRSLLQFSDQMQRSGITKPVMEAALESARSGDFYETPEAIAQYNAQRTDKTRGYNEDKTDIIKAAFKTKKGISIPPTLSADFDAAYTALLETTSSPQKSIEMAIEQVKGRYTASYLFVGNIGPSSVLNTYPQPLIAEFFFKSKRSDGTPLIPVVPGQKHRIFGENNPTIRLKPLDSNTAGIGRYAVYITEPNNPSKTIGYIPDLDLGRELQKYVKQKRIPADRARVDPVAEARKKRDEDVDFWKRFGEGADRRKN